jgi:hypothetical protein
METLRLVGDPCGNGEAARRPAAPRYSIHRAYRHRVARTEMGYRRKVLVPRSAGHFDFIPEAEIQDTEADADDESDASQKQTPALE